jgi:non-ribosomal peptide synthetase-like protein
MGTEKQQTILAGKSIARLDQNTQVNPVMLQQLFERTANKMPNQIALICEGKEYSYRDLDQYANQIARHLSSSGAKAQDRIGILLNRSIETYAAIIAVLKLGATYIPLDTSYPIDRINYIIDDADITLLISTEPVIAQKAEINCAQVLLDREKTDIKALSADPPKVDLPDNPENEVCYIIYTSGSTGRPKGVQIEHRSIVNFLNVVADVYGFHPDDRVFQGMSIAFDFSFEEIWTAFNAGSTLVMVPVGECSLIGGDLANFLTDNKVTVLVTVPTLLSSIEEDIPGLRLINIGGEPVPQHLVELWAKPGRRILNTYGPTETTVTATWAEMEKGKPVTIGRPLPSYMVFIADEEGQQVPNGEIGEICIGGIGVARGYVKRPDLTAKCFIPDPDAEQGSDARYYRTGDLGRYTNEGEIEYHGRADLQVKLRGYRIELSEIESVLMKSENVQAAAAAVVSISDGINELVAYVIPKLGHDIDKTKLHSLLQEHLPHYMVPAYIEPIDEFPVLTSGKIDRKALPKPGLTRLGSNKPFVAPEGEMENKVSDIWRSVLRLDKISVTNDFFTDLGGHSLLAARVVSKLREHPEFVNLSMVDFYASPTIQKLSLLAVKSEATYEINETSTVELPKTTKIKSNITWKSASFQTLALYAFFALPGAMLLGWVYLSQSLARYNAFQYNIVTYYALVAFVMSLLYFPISILLPIAAKKLLIGRFIPGRYPLWGSYYLRCWLLTAIQSMTPLGVFAGTPIINWYSRMMGAKIGKNCHIGTGSISCHDLISIGDNTSIGAGSNLPGFTITSDYIEFNTIDIGSDCYVGANSFVSINTAMGDGAMLLEQSQLASGSEVPPGHVASGSPARSSKIEKEQLQSIPGTSGTYREPDGLMHIAGFVFSAFMFLPIVPSLASVPGILLLVSIYLNPVYSSNPLVWMGGLISASVLFISSLCLLITGFKRLILPSIKPGEYPLRSMFYLRKWTVDRLVGFSLALSNALYGTLYLTPFLRMLGAKIGVRGEISTVSNITPELLTIKDEAFVADMASIGAARVYHGMMMVAPITIGNRTFIGNAALAPVGADIPDGCLIGVQSTPPKGTIDPGSSWLGLPPIYLPRRQIIEGFEEEQTFKPPLSAYALRYVYEFFRATLPPAFAYGTLAATLLLTVKGYLALGPVLLLPLLPFMYLGVSLTATFIVAALKWIFIGRYKPRIEPLWSHFVRRTEFITALYENITVPMLLGPLLGTPFSWMVLRLFGAKIAKDALLLTTYMTEFDLVEVGEKCAINSGVSLQTHLFEDRVMKMSHVRVGPGSTVGQRSVVLYDSEMKAGSQLGNLSLLMKGEVLAEGSKWEGSPAQPVSKLQEKTALPQIASENTRYRETFPASISRVVVSRSINLKDE